MTKYYFVTTLLPSLKIGSPPELESHELDFLLKLNLTSEDYEKVTSLRQITEIENIRKFWGKDPIEPGGNYTEKELEENLLHLENYPPYLFAYMEQYPDGKERLKHFPELIREFFRIEIENAQGFTKEYLIFEWKWRLVITALRAKNLGRNLLEEFRFEDPENPFVQEILSQANAPTYEPPEDFQVLKTLFETKKSHPLEFSLALAEWRFEHIEEMVGWDTFDIDFVLGYIVLLEICETWLRLDRKKGLELIEKVAGS